MHATTDALDEIKRQIAEAAAGDSRTIAFLEGLTDDELRSLVGILCVMGIDRGLGRYWYE